MKCETDLLDNNAILTKAEKDNVVAILNEIEYKWKVSNVIN